MDSGVARHEESVCSNAPGKPGSSWTSNEIAYLLKIWGEQEVKHSLSSLKRNYHIYSDISRELEKNGIHRGPKECRTKCKRLKQEYRQAKYTPYEYVKL
ncbi:hypothetical protein JRQ81_014424 [Phrynocephalus forsythii]|uniref:Myb/SANT-like DNA-binding domain-containing protein n=1 Tax=Phrynocephalus forsythii TaxID=171643 RepID=A0A9Q0XWN1_9SAUR|nr:hypothetical protein JRQ81_014424 [Phrynocephalus forsythii]